MPLNQVHNQISNQTISVLPFKPDGPMNILSESENRFDIDQSTAESSSTLVTNEKPPTGLDHTLFGETIVSIQVNGQRYVKIRNFFGRYKIFDHRKIITMNLMI